MLVWLVSPVAIEDWLLVDMASLEELLPSGSVVVTWLGTLLDDELLIVVDKLGLIKDVLALVGDVGFWLEVEMLAVVDELDDVAAALLVEGGGLLLEVGLVTDSLEIVWLVIASLDVISLDVDFEAMWTGSSSGEMMVSFESQVVQTSRQSWTEADMEVSVCQLQLSETFHSSAPEVVSFLSRVSTRIRGGRVVVAGDGTVDAMAEVNKPMVIVEGRNMLRLVFSEW